MIDIHYYYHATQIKMISTIRNHHYWYSPLTFTKHTYIHTYIFLATFILDIFVVGGFNPSAKFEFVSWEYYSQDMESHEDPNHQPVINNHD